jgi:hypothetical protein
MTQVSDVAPGPLVYFVEVIFCDLKRYRGIFMAYNYEHNFYAFYFWRIKNGREKCEN